jgi:DNA-binding SARP family transcriptional activator/tetratricopeptide (TPR) repeat protein
VSKAGKTSAVSSANGVWFGLLGPLLVRSDDGELRLTAAKQRVLLASLLCRPGLVISADELVEYVWDGAPPAGGHFTLHSYVKRLRQRLGPIVGARIETCQPGYLIRIETEELDTARFNTLVRAGEEAMRVSSWGQATTVLTEALHLWRSTPLADVPSEKLGRGVRPNWEQMRLEAIELRNDADLHLGRHTALVPELYTLIEQHPLQERFYAQLMLALYRGDRQADALAVYQSARRLLVEQLGVEPNSGLQELHKRILTADSELRDYPAAAGRPAVGAASMLTATTAAHAAALDGQCPEPIRPAAEPRQLPTAVQPFVGRVAELTALTKLADHTADATGTELILVTGTAGVGKTALAVHWAHEVADRFPDGQLYVNLRGFGPAMAAVTPTHAIRRFLGALGVPADRMPLTLEGCEDLYRSLLADKRMLVVLDNARDVTQVRPLLPGGRRCMVIVTSRGQLTGLVAAEGALPLSLDVLSQAQAGELLIRRLTADRTAAEPGVITEVIEQCARLPLALAAAAARIAVYPGLSLASLATELRHTGGLLHALDTGDEESSIRTVFSWSYEILSGRASRMFRLLGLHGGPDIAAAAAASLGGLSLTQTHQLLAELVHANLLSSRSPGRFAFHNLLRVYAAERAETEEDKTSRGAAIGRVLQHYAHTAYAADRLLSAAKEPLVLARPQSGVAPEGIADYRQALAWFQDEYQVLVVAVEFAAKTGFDAYAWQIAWCLTTIFDLEGRWQDGAAVQRTALTCAERVSDKVGLARAHSGLSASLIQLGALGDADVHLQHALRLCAELGDKLGEAQANLGLSQVAGRQGQNRRALRHAEQALVLHQTAGHLAGQGRARSAIGWCRARLGNHEQALADWVQAMARYRESHDGLGEATAWDSLGHAHSKLGEYAKAIACCQRAIDLAGELGARHQRAQALTHLGDIRRDTGDAVGARNAWQQAIDILDELRRPDAGQAVARLQNSWNDRAEDHREQLA